MIATRKTLPLTLLLLLPLTAAAQRITITPTAGAYLPLRDQARWVSVEGCCDRPDERGATLTTTERVKLEVGLNTGLKVTVGEGPVGLEASIGTAALRRRSEVSSLGRLDGVPVTPPSVRTEVLLARSTTAALRLTLGKRVSERADLAFGVGLSTTHLSGPAYASRPPRDRTNRGFSVGMTVAVAPVSGSRLEIGVTDNVYSLESTGLQPGRRGSFTQHDVVVSAGFGLVLGR